MSKETLPVCFRVYRSKKEPYYNDCVAIFPTVPEDRSGYSAMIYEHVGMHGSAYIHHMVAITKPATEEQYTDLKRELESIGYDNLRIVQRPGAACYRAIRRQTAIMECTK